MVEYKTVADYFEKSVENVKDVNSYKNCCNLILSLIFSKFETEAEKENFKILVSEKEMAKLLNLLETKKIRNNMAKKALEEMLETGKKVEEVISFEDLKEITKEELENFYKDAVKNNEKAVKDYLNGKTKAIKALV